MRSTSIIQSLPVAVVVFDSNLKIVEANAEAASLIDLRDRIDQSLAKGTDHSIWQDWTELFKSAISSDQIARFDDVEYASGHGRMLLRIACNAAAHVGSEGGPGGIAVIEDMSEKVQMQRRLSDSERLAAIGRRASKVAHELNNPLDGILRYINLTIRLVEQARLDKPQVYLTQCRDALMRMVRIVGELLEFSRSTYSPYEYVRIDQAIEDAIRPMEPRASSLNVRISRNYSLGLPRVRGGNLFQVFSNLAKNALDAMPDGGELAITTRRLSGDTIAVEFRDTGPGLPDGCGDKIFEPFFTTKDKGTGLGLAICRDIVESCRGRITAESTPGGGSVFTVYLPARG